MIVLMVSYFVVGHSLPRHWSMLFSSSRLSSALVSGAGEASLPANDRHRVWLALTVSRCWGFLLRVIIESSRGCPAAMRLFCVTRGGPWATLFFTPHPSLAVGVVTGPASRPLWGSDSIVATLWYEDVCAWVPSLESDCWMSSPTCDHTASCRAYALPVFEGGCLQPDTVTNRWKVNGGGGAV